MTENLNQCIEEISKNIGNEHINMDRPTRIAYRIAHGPEATLHETLSDFTPACVMHPRTTEEVVEIVKCANKYMVPIIAQGGRTCSYGAEAMYGSIVLDMTSMDKIIDLDQAAYRVTAEAGVRLIDLSAFLEKHNLLNLEIPTMNKTSTLSSRAAVSGYNKYENRFGGSMVNIKGLEVVLPNGEVVQTGRGTKLPVRSAVGMDNMSLFIGSRGTLGIITKLTERVIPIPEEYHYGIKAFKNYDDAINAYIELKSPLNSSRIWRCKTYPKWLLSQAVKMYLDTEWPEDVKMLVDYHILGPKEVVKEYKKIAEDICQKHNGFWRDDLPPSDFVAQSHSSAEKYMGMACLQSERLINGGRGNRIVPLDPMISDRHLSTYYQEALEVLNNIENTSKYPNLAKCMYVLTPGSLISAEEGWTKVWILTLLDWKNFGPEAIDEFKKWFRSEYVEMVWRNGGTLSGTHGFIPRDLEVEIIKKETGEAGYKLMKTIKETLDPNNIMNPKIKF